MMNQILTILIGSIFVNNFAMSRFYGICPFLGVSKKLETAFGMGMAVTFVMAIASLVAYLVDTFLLVPFGLEYLQTIAFILVIAVLVQIVEMALKKMSPGLYQALGVYLPLITTNCAVLGVCISNITAEYSFVQAMFNSLGSGLGFFLAMVLFSGVRGRMENNNCPACFKGLPITLIAAAILSCSFFGFAGVVDNIFG